MPPEQNPSKLSDNLPPLIFGTATFNYQFNPDPYALGPTDIVHKALKHGVRAFDTSPYYGPAEIILGNAFATDYVQTNYRREEYFILTKVGRVAADVFDYSPEWIRHSVARSCERLRTTYLDVVYCHDAEFVTPHEVLVAIRELRRIRDSSGTVKYVGICGYPVDILCDLAEMILRETGEPLDIVQSYANYTIQNTLLHTRALDRLVKAGVDVVPNASPLGMGLLRRQGPPIGAMGNWHPAPDGLREACAKASQWVETKGEKLEVVAVRFALENWLRIGAVVGTSGAALGSNTTTTTTSEHSQKRLGVNVMGVSKVDELDETMRVWRSVLDGIIEDIDINPATSAATTTPYYPSDDDALSDQEWSLQRRQQIRGYAREIRTMLGAWADYPWQSPDEGFVNKGNQGFIAGVVGGGEEDEKSVSAVVMGEAAGATMTPPPERELQERRVQAMGGSSVR